MFDAHRGRYILASGGETSEIAKAGVAVVMRQGELWMEVRARKPNHKFIYENQNPIRQNRWFYLAIVWKLYFTKLEVYIDSSKTIIDPAAFTPASNQLAAHMYIGKASHTNSTHYFGNFYVILDSYSRSWVLTLIQNILLRRATIWKILKSNYIIVYWTISQASLIQDLR